jgi:hypothetical protein
MHSWTEAPLDGKIEAMSDLVRILTTSSIPEGEVARSRLEAEGIPVLVKGGGETYRLGPVHLFVTADLEEQARSILARKGPDPG